MDRDRPHVRDALGDISAERRQDSTMKTSVTVTLVFLTLVSIIHLVRFALQVNVTVDEFVVPMWLSLVAFLALGGLAVWLWKDERTS
jgi:hypothetical protein